MNISFDLKNIDAARAMLRGLPDKKINVAAVAALNAAAYAGQQAASAEMSRVFDRPTPFVLRGVRYSKARKDKIESRIDLDFWGNKQGVSVEQVLNAEIHGGLRRNKRHEVALQRARILPAGYQIVPGAGAEIDAYGNMKGGQINQIMSWFQAFGEVGYKANSTPETRKRNRKSTSRRYGYEYFVVSPGRGSNKLTPGIYKRTFLAHGSAIKPVMIFVRPGQYQRRYDFYGVTHAAAYEAFEKAFPTYLAQLLAERGL